MNCIMEEILKNPKPNSELRKIVEFLGEDINRLYNELQNINKEALYQNEIHGIYHSEKTLLFAYVISKIENIDQKDLEIIIDAAIYHDIGRNEDYFDTLHGYVGANKLPEVIPLNKYTFEEFRLLQSIVDAHSQDKSNERINFENWELPEEMYERYLKLVKILKDAEHLDRNRFGEESIIKIHEIFLRLDSTKKLIELSSEVDLAYAKEIKGKTEEHKIQTDTSGACFHSVGFDFFKMVSILKHGIFSASEFENENIKSCKNFTGGNQEDWISVVSAKYISEKNDKQYLDNFLIDKHTGFKTFTKNGIGFFCEAPELVSPLPADRKQEARIKGLPYNKSNHYDERYVYHEIPREEIYMLMIPEKYVNKEIDELMYLYNSLDFYLFISKISYFAEFFIEEGIELLTPELLSLEYAYEDVLDKIDLSKYDGLGNIPEQLNPILNKINAHIQQAMLKYYQSKLQRNDKITVYDVVKYELEKLNLIQEEYHTNSSITIPLTKIKKR